MEQVSVMDHVRSGGGTSEEGLLHRMGLPLFPVCYRKYLHACVFRVPVLSSASVLVQQRTQVACSGHRTFILW